MKKRDQMPNEKEKQEVTMYKRLIVSMLDKINDERFLRQIYTIIKLYIEREGR